MTHSRESPVQLLAQLPHLTDGVGGGGVIPISLCILPFKINIAVVSPKDGGTCSFSI